MVAAWHEAGDGIALVPTMGNLHKGHLNLISRAAERGERVVVSIFVNPTQFGPTEDFERYPRTMEVDMRKLNRAGVDLLFAPSVAEMYPRGLDQATAVIVPEISDDLCGIHRPGHFAGVTSVVCRLFNICSPDIAVFGMKDYQQLIVISRMVEDLHLPIRLIAGPTEREPSGLAMSSRNGGLSDDEQVTAAAIFRVLNWVGTTLQSGNHRYDELESEARAQLSAAGLEPDYVAVRNAADLSAPPDAPVRLAVLAAARLGGVRLIDNLIVDMPAD